jgi:cyanophycinase
MGVIALLGGKGFDDLGENREVTRRLLDLSGGTEVLLLPTADAFEAPALAVEAATAWFAGLGATVRPLMVLGRGDAMDPSMAAAIEQASFVYLVGDSPMHLRSSLKDTPVWAAIVAAADRSVVAAAGSPIQASILYASSPSQLAGSPVSTAPQQLTGTGAPQPVSPQTVSGLSPGTYYYQVQSVVGVAPNQQTVLGPVQSFTVSPAPP